MRENPEPECAYRLATPEEWEAGKASGVIPLRDIDVRDGFVHLSTKAQALETARLHFADADDLLALEIPLERIKDKVKFELAPKRGGDFPHLYGTLRADHVAQAIRLERGEDGFRFGAPV